MVPELLSLLLLALGSAVLVYVALGRWANRRRIALGLAQGVVLAADDSRLGMLTLRSDRLGLVGRPDQLLRAGQTIIPIEHKPRASRLQPSHELQIAAQCALVEEVYGVRPPYGLVVLADGAQERVHFTPALELRLLRTMAHMREMLAAAAEPGPRWVAARCRACGYHDTCWIG